MYVIQHNIRVDMVVLLIQFMRLFSYNTIHCLIFLGNHYNTGFHLKHPQRSPSISVRVPLYPLPTDSTFTFHNVNAAVESVQDWDDLGYHLGVPHGKHGSRREMLQYFITTVPNASWQVLAGGLYYQQEHAALEKVTKYYQPHPGMSGWGL